MSVISYRTAKSMIVMQRTPRSYASDQLESFFYFRKNKRAKTLTIIEEAKTIQEIELETQYIDQSAEFDTKKMPDHEWIPCVFKNATFCMVCGKLTSQLGLVPMDAMNNVMNYAYKHGPNVNREGP